jgi:DNA repair exonuclease SbcCD ATPase subunit
VEAYRFLEGEAETLETAPEEESQLRSRIDELERRIETLQRTGADDTHQQDQLREEVSELSTTVADAAPADHTHSELAEQAAEAADEAAAARDDVESLRARVDEGFDNYGDVLEYLTEATDDLEEKLTRIARHLVDLRRDVRDVQAAAAGRAAAAELKAEGNRHGESHARCSSCSATVDLGLLSTPQCPQCGSTFDGFDPGSGLFSSAKLTVGERPALDGETRDETDRDDDAATLGDLFEEV